MPHQSIDFTRGQTTVFIGEREMLETGVANVPRKSVWVKQHALASPQTDQLIGQSQSVSIKFCICLFRRFSVAFESNHVGGDLSFIIRNPHLTFSFEKRKRPHTVENLA
jgi:hypothetical protein